MGVLDLNDVPGESASDERHVGRIPPKALRALNERAAEIARALLGPENPDHSRPGELRFGTNGSVSIEIASGDYYNHERKIGGGILQMLVFEGGMANGAAIDWLKGIGIELEREAPKRKLHERIVATYDYRDEHGNLLFQVARLQDPKDFRQRRPDGNGGWEWSVKGTRIVPYRLPELQASNGSTVYVVEGEKDVDRLSSSGLVATCNPGGAGKWPDDFASYLTGRDVVILPDNDTAGKEHGQQVATNLVPKAKRVRMLELPGLPPKGDVSDWLAAGGSRDELERLAAAAPECRPAAAGDLIDPAAPYKVAKLFIERRFTVDDGRTLQHHRGGFYRWSGSAYPDVTEATLRSDLYAYLDQCTMLDPQGRRQRVKPNTTMVNHMVDGLRAAAHLDDNAAAPMWLYGGGPQPDEIVACSNGLLHLPTLQLLPHTPAFFTHNALDFAFDPEAPPPRHWLGFLQELWPQDPVAVETLQEIFGLALTGDTRHQKAFLFVGPKRSGKGTIARVLTRLICPENVVAPTLAGLGMNFGLAPLIGKRLAIISDARLGGRADQAAIAERILSITGEDAITVDRKFIVAWTGKLQARFIILSNELPRLADASGALASRFIVLVMTKSFFGMEDRGLTDRLLGELSGILNWSIAGWQRLNERGYFRQPVSASEAVRELEDLGSPIGAFLRDNCEIGPGFVVLPDDLYKAWCWWCESQGRDKPGTKQSFGRDLRAAVPGLMVSRPRGDDGSRERVYESIRLKVGVPETARGVDLNAAPLQRDDSPNQPPWWIH